jgi:hypothetical protein
MCEQRNADASEWFPLTINDPSTDRAPFAHLTVRTGWIAAVCGGSRSKVHALRVVSLSTGELSTVC